MDLWRSLVHVLVYTIISKYVFPSTFRPSLTQDIASPACKASIERRLASKSQELQETREKFKEVQHREQLMMRENEALKSRLEDKGTLLKKVEAERDVLERDMTHYITEVNVSENLGILSFLFKCRCNV